MGPHTRDAWHAVLMFLAIAVILALASLTDIVFGGA